MCMPDFKTVYHVCIPRGKNAYPLLTVMRLPFPFTLCDQCTPLLYTGTLYRYSIPVF